MNPLLLALKSKNPMEFLKNAAQHNPQVANALNIINQLNAVAPEQQEQFVRNFCQQQGINFDSVKQQYEQFIGGLQNNGQYRTNNK